MALKIKEQQKQGKTKEDISLTEIAQKIRGNKVPIENNKEDIEKGDIGEEFERILEEAMVQEYETTGVVYIDANIKEVFDLIKKRKKVTISNLTSWILHQWIEKHSEDIKKLNTNVNPFF